MTPTARTPKTTPHRRIAVGGGQPLSAAALTPGRTQTARRRRSAARRAGPGHRRGSVADRGIGAAAGRRSRCQHRPSAGGAVAVRLPAHPGHPGRLRRRRRRRDRPCPDRRAGHLPLPGISDQHFVHRAARAPERRIYRVGLARAAAHAGYRTYFTTAADLAARCHRAAIEGRWATTMRFFAGPTLLVIDELGYLPLPAEAASALFQVVSQRYLKTSIVITTNRGVGAWGDILGDTTVAAAMLDRLLHRSVVINLDGESYRLRDHHAAADTLRRATTGTRQPIARALASES